ncbi:MAG: translocation/assembly module TamB domain-containing protein [Candidatus Omnitrophota bacterium]|nr:translocation/assembly module TamB domain-containing protein [Candidatus Omnitrophota bacterium]MDZ4241848.1 translocation/assembly module TamB domain-containing protein [Candidatus Omnitrophota bacterium]
MKKKIFIISILIILFASGILAWAGLCTTPGARLLAEYLVPAATGYGRLSIGRVEGTVVRGLNLKNVKITHLRGFPPGSVLAIKTVFLDPVLWGSRRLVLEVVDGRLSLPRSSEPVVIFGKVDDGRVDFDIYGRSLDAQDIMSFFPRATAFKRLSGTLTEVDLHLEGTAAEFFITGSGFFEKLLHKGFLLEDCPALVNVKLVNPRRSPELYGEVFLESGVVRSKRMKVYLDPSKIRYDGNPQTPVLDLKGHAAVAQTDIKISLRGSHKKPEMFLSSQPPLRQEILLLMLVTGKGWKGLEESAGRGAISPDLAGDFVDYIFLGGSGSRLAQQLGISDVSLTYDQSKKGLEVRKDIFGKMKVGYGIEQELESSQSATVSQKMGGEYQVTDEVSVGVEREIKQSYDPNTSEKTDVPAEDDKVLLKYQKRF